MVHTNVSPVKPVENKITLPAITTTTQNPQTVVNTPVVEKPYRVSDDIDFLNDLRNRKPLAQDQAYLDSLRAKYPDRVSQPNGTIDKSQMLQALDQKYGEKKGKPFDVNPILSFLSDVAEDVGTPGQIGSFDAWQAKKAFDQLARESQSMKNQSEAQSMQIQKEAQDPNSEISQRHQAIWEQMLGHKLPVKMSASDIEKYAPEIARMDIAQDRMGARGTGTPKITEDQNKSALFADRMIRGNDAFSQAGFSPDTLGLSSMTPNALKNPNQQKAEQAEKEWIAGLLRKESGAVIGPEEYKTYGQMYFPRSGDSTEVKAQKEQARKAQTRAMLASAGPAYNMIANTNYPGSNNTQPPASTPQAQSGTVNVMWNGKPKTIPASKLQEALNAGAKPL